MKNLKLVTLAGALTSLAVVAAAQNNAVPAPQPNTPGANQTSPEQPRRIGRWQRLDANSDGAIDQQEFVTAQRLKEADANGDGTLTTDELVAMIEKQRAERLAARLTRRLDIDGDGKVTLAEIEKQKAERFALLDRNDDGKLERNELRQTRQFGGHRKFGQHGGRGDHRGGERFELDL